MSFLDRVIFNAASGGTGDFVEASAALGYQLMEQAGALTSGVVYPYAAQLPDLTQWEIGLGTLALPTPVVLQDSSTFVAQNSPSPANAADAPKGSLIVVVLYPNDAATQTFTSVVDSAGNTYTQAVYENPNNPNYFGVGIWYCSNTQFDLPAGGTFTAFGSDGYFIGAIAIAGANGGLDQTGETFVDSTTISVPLAAPTSPVDIVFAATSFSSGVTFNESPGFTTILGQGSLAFQYTTKATSYDPTWTPAAFVTGVIASFKLSQFATLQRTTVLYNSLQTGTKQSGAGSKINFTSPPQVSPMLLAEEAALLSLPFVKGNVIVGDGSEFAVLTVGGDGLVLTADSTQPFGVKWAAGGGASSWLYKNANYAAVATNKILADTSAGAFTITLPASPSVGDFVDINDATTSWATNNLTIAHNGSNIQGIADDMIANVNGAALELIYEGSTVGWAVYQRPVYQ